jgi:hypothetical protein
MQGVEPARFLTTEARILPGVRKVITVPAPAATAEWSVTVPGGEQWRILGGQAAYVAVGGGGTRYTGIVSKILGVTVWQVVGTAEIAGSETISIIYSQAIFPFDTPTYTYYGTIQAAPFWHGSGDTIGSITADMQADDQYTNVSLVVESCYVTNPQLSDIEEAREREIAREWQQIEASQAGGN